MLGVISYYFAYLMIIVAAQCVKLHLNNRSLGQCVACNNREP